ncbi:unnamed protein product [Thelazia callipaeda]|uniref:DUF4760 domain-containing protein n=1 Tax=Thelazia callipaeda TaxID=103827 RepID=A0A0N5CSR0_THECL|nr:unnamed protein product [Thelazia callipaeda]
MYEYDDMTGSLMALTASVFAYYWFLLYGCALTRERKAFLDISNILDTIYNRKYGEFYESDPDTPGNAANTFKKAVATSIGDVFNETMTSADEDHIKFEEAVQKHYAGVYEAVRRAEREMETNAPNADDLCIRKFNYIFEPIVLLASILIKHLGKQKD